MDSSTRFFLDQEAQASSMLWEEGRMQVSLAEECSLSTEEEQYWMMLKKPVLQTSSFIGPPDHLNPERMAHQRRRNARDFSHWLIDRQNSSAK